MAWEITGNLKGPLGSFNLVSVEQSYIASDGEFVQVLADGSQPPPESLEITLPDLPAGSTIRVMNMAWNRSYVTILGPSPWTEDRFIEEFDRLGNGYFAEYKMLEQDPENLGYLMWIAISKWSAAPKPDEWRSAFIDSNTSEVHLNQGVYRAYGHDFVVASDTPVGARVYLPDGHDTELGVGNVYPQTVYVVKTDNSINSVGVRTEDPTLFKIDGQLGGEVLLSRKGDSVLLLGQGTDWHTISLNKQGSLFIEGPDDQIPPVSITLQSQDSENNISGSAYLQANNGVAFYALQGYPDGNITAFAGGNQTHINITAADGQTEPALMIGTSSHADVLRIYPDGTFDPPIPPGRSVVVYEQAEEPTEALTGDIWIVG